MGSRLRTLQKEKKGLRGKGKFTKHMIDKLQNYNGIAIRENTMNLTKMKKAVHATLLMLYLLPKMNGCKKP